MNNGDNLYAECSKLSVKSEGDRTSHKGGPIVDVVIGRLDGTGDRVMSNLVFDFRAHVMSF